MASFRNDWFKKGVFMHVLKAWFWAGICVSLMSLARAGELPDFTHLVDENNQAVVNISASSKVKGGQQQDPQELFRRFFGGEDPNAAPSQQQERQSFGSGFIISKDGYVLTNNHVVKDADKVVVRLSDRRELDAEVVGTDERADIALLKISAKDLPQVKIGHPDQLKVGEWVVAIGSPFGFEYTVTAGIVSAKARALPNEAYVPFIQTDVAINPGNSGGPLFNMNGEVVGINSQIYSRSGGFMGLSFAIPIDVAMESVEQIKKDGKVERGYLGVVIQEITKDLADVYGLAKPAGALVAKVLPDSPAEKAGLKEGDVITAFNGKSIGLSSELPQMIGRVKVGSKQQLSVVREGKPLTLDFVVTALPADDGASLGGGGANKPDSKHLGISLRDLSEQEKQNLKITDGVLVTQVYEGPAANVHLLPGDVIVRLNRQPMKSVQVYLDVVRHLPIGKPVEMVVNRRGQQVIVAITLDK